jgi:Bacterial Ig-like domain (group 3)
VTPGFIRTAACAVIAVLALALAPGAFAASELGDAGELRETANDMGAGPVTEIQGSFTDAADVDLYRVCLSDGESFSASTIGATTLDTQIFLLDSQGYGIYANDDSSGSRGSLLPARHRFSPRAGGEFFLGLSAFNRDPQSSQGEIFPNSFNRTIYPDSIVDAAGFGGREPLAGWAGRASGPPGTYRITLTGTTGCDSTPPAVDLRAPADGAHVTRNAEVVVDFSCSDEQGGSGLASCVGTTADGDALDTSRLGDVSVTVTARDNAGNQRVVTHTITVVDETSPEASIATPEDGAVYERGESVTADYSCSDEPGGSGLESCVGDVAAGAAVDTSTLGQQNFTVQATDRAGNTGSKTVSYTVVDRTAPVISVTTPAAGAVYGLGESVTADYECQDEPGGSGLAGCTGPTADGAAVDTSSVGEKTFRVEATDSAGNTASKSLTYTVVDQAPPAITLRAPADGAVYSLGQSVVAAYSCEDQPGGSGVASCHGTVPSGASVDTSSFGVHSFEVSASDGAGNTSSKVVTYTVAYEFDGFKSPVKNTPNVNKWKAGQPVPIRFSLRGFRGPRPEADGYPRSMRCGGGDSEQVARAHSHASTKQPMFKYLDRSDEYVMRWKTHQKWAGSCREFVLQLDDGSVHAARFEFTKNANR